MMKKYIIIATLFMSCSRAKRTPETYTFDASKDTSFVVSRSSPIPLRIELDIQGELQDSIILLVSCCKSMKNGPIVQEKIFLSSGVVNIKNKTFDFYDDNALFTFIHLNNKKGKLTIKASL